MKRLICVLLVFLLILSFCGCSFSKLDPGSEHTFFYRQAELQYGKENGIIEQEIRDVSGHDDDLFYLITLYFAGPLDESLLSPFPASTRLLSVEQDKQNVLIKLTDSGTPLLDSEHSLACACLALTCLEFTEIEQVTIQYRDRTITLNRESIMLLDTSSHPQLTTEETQ